MRSSPSRAAREIAAEPAPPFSGADAALAIEALGGLDIGVVVCTRALDQILFANEAARLQLRELWSPVVHPTIRAAIATSRERESVGGPFTPAVAVLLPTGRRLFVRTRLIGGSVLVTLTGEVMRERALYELLHERFRLSVRERELIALLRAGYSNEQIGRDLGISVGTVKQYLNRVFKTFDVHSRGELVATIERIARDKPGG
jgi:DNA-binding CsgD family transcriptional regulator